MFEALTGNTPTLQQASLDPGTQKLIGDAVSTAGQSDATTAAKYNNGVSESGGQGLQTEAAGKQEAAGLGMNNGFGQAIRNQYNGISGGQTNSLMRTNQMNTPFYRQQALDMATKAAFAQKQVENQNYMQLMQANTDAEIARANVLNGVLTGAGTLAGAYMGSRMRGSRSSPMGQSPSLGSEFQMNNYGGANTFGGSDMAARLGR